MATLLRKGDKVNQYPSWPTVQLPKISDKFKFPHLELALTYGSNEALSQEVISLYVCGITPYDATHLGHAATYLTYDLINRYLQASGRAVLFAENITDIDDPLLERAIRDNVKWEDLADSQIDLFRSYMSALHILPPNHYVPVTHVIDQIALDVKKLVDKGVTYSIDGDIYLEVTPYLELLTPFTGLSYEEALKIFSERGGDPSRIGKKEALDPLLWRAHRDGEPFWESPVGRGRPGWHIECTSIALSTISLKGKGSGDASHLGHEISLQGGGSDLIFPHHFMSEVQSLALTGKSFSGAYSHAGMIGLDGEKMSKSKGNLVFVSRLLQEGVEPMTIRWALLDHHYRADLMWSNSLLENAANNLHIVHEALSRPGIHTSETSVEDLINRVIKLLSQDLNTAGALSEIVNWSQHHIEVSDDQTLAPSSDLRHDGVGELSRAMDLLLGLAL
jgi:L-cysteine:1D-myo-inositol 2-amino-2-deoxy-alpha-D-glucopyranoside ligase